MMHEPVNVRESSPTENIPKTDTIRTRLMLSVAAAAIGLASFMTTTYPMMIESNIYTELAHDDTIPATVQDRYTKTADDLKNVGRPIAVVNLFLITLSGFSTALHANKLLRKNDAVSLPATNSASTKTE